MQAGAWAARAAGLVAGSSVLFPWKTAECMPYKGAGPRVQAAMPKRSKKRHKQEGLDCVPLMMQLLACYKAHNFDKQKCTFEQERLMKCTTSLALEVKKKDTSRYHMMRLLLRMKR